MGQKGITVGKINFEKRWEAKHPLYRLEAVIRAYADYPDIPGCECKNMLMSIRDTVVSTYFDKDELAKAPKVGLETIKNQKIMRQYLADGHKTYDELVRISKIISESKLSRISNDDLKRLYQQYFNFLSKTFGAYYNLSRPDYLLEIDKKINATLRQKIRNIEERSEVFLKLTSPEENSLLTLHDIDQLKFFILILKNEYYESIDDLKRVLNENKIIRELKLLREKYAWISTLENNPPLDEDYYVKKAKESLALGEKYLQKNINDLLARPSVLRQAKRKLIEKYDLPAELVRLAKTVADLAELRLNIRFSVTKSSFSSQGLFLEINRRLNFEADHMGNSYYSEFLLKKEVEDFLNKDKRINLKKISQRIKRSLFLMLDKKIVLYVGGQADEIENRYIPKEDYSLVNELKGNVANRGLAQGKTWVISPSIANQVEKARKMPKGYILVASMTRPQFIEGISKSAAIITDEGGITCHAAIVSRELGIPCVIGTKIATKVLKDGDSVEVDANQGIVKILKKAAL